MEKTVHLSKRVHLANNEQSFTNYFIPSINEINIINGAQSINQILTTIPNPSINVNDQPYLLSQHVFTPVFNSNYSKLFFYFEKLLKKTNNYCRFNINQFNSIQTESSEPIYESTFGNELLSNATVVPNFSTNFIKPGKILKTFGNRHLQNPYLNPIKGTKRKTQFTVFF